MRIGPALELVEVVGPRPIAISRHRVAGSTSCCCFSDLRSQTAAGCGRSSRQQELRYVRSAESEEMCPPDSRVPHQETRESGYPASGMLLLGKHRRHKPGTATIGLPASTGRHGVRLHPSTAPCPDPRPRSISSSRRQHTRWDVLRSTWWSHRATRKRVGGKPEGGGGRSNRSAVWAGP